MDADLSMLGQSEKISIDWYAYVVCLPSLMRLVCPATEVERTSSRAVSSTPPRSESPVNSRRVVSKRAPHYFNARAVAAELDEARASPLASNATGIFAAATSRNLNPRCPPAIPAWAEWAECTKP